MPCLCDHKVVRLVVIAIANLAALNTRRNVTIIQAKVVEVLVGHLAIGGDSFVQVDG